MAYIIGDDLYDPWGKTWAEFVPNDDEVWAFFRKTRANPYTITKSNWRSGTRIPPELMPKHLKITKGGALSDWRTARGGAQLVSGAFKDCVEAIEPDQHQFFPVTIEDRKGAPKPGPWFILNIVGYVEAIIEEKSNLSPMGKETLAGWLYQRPAGPWECALDASIIGHRACWTELRYPGRYFVSDRLVASLKEHGLGGYDLDYYCSEVSRA